jgi:hypothetical protein
MDSLSPSEFRPGQARRRQSADARQDFPLVDADRGIDPALSFLEQLGNVGLVLDHQDASGPG